MRDPKKLFVVNAISRADIADEINQNCDRGLLKPDDERLSDEFCIRFANELGQTDEEDVAELCERFAHELGLADGEE